MKKHTRRPPLFGMSHRTEAKVIQQVDQIVRREDKGEQGKECYRSACNNTPANYYNHSTRKYYCTDCAMAINRMNHHDAQRLFGHDLCTLRDSDKSDE